MRSDSQQLGDTKDPKSTNNRSMSKDGGGEGKDSENKDAPGKENIHEDVLLGNLAEPSDS